MNCYRGEVRLTVNAERHGAQYPQFKPLLDAATPSDDTNSSTEDDSMAVGVRRMRQGRRRRRVGVAVLGDNEIIGIILAVV